jgi:two-component system response regulator YesN
MKILFVDDEKIIRDSMRNIIEWDKIGCSKLAFADSAVTALSHLKKEKFDLVITDIFMQRMDGIELSTYIRNNYPDIKVIVLSAYEDFNMARGAIKAGVLQYLLKPIVPHELEEAIFRAKKLINEKQELQDSAVESEKMVDLYRPVVEESFWRDLLEGRVANKEQIAYQTRIAGIDLSEEKLACMLVRCKGDNEEIRCIIFNTLPMALGCVRMDQHCTAVIVREGLSMEAMEELHAVLQEQQDPDVVLSGGHYVEEMSCLRESYSAAVKKMIVYSTMRLDQVNSWSAYGYELEQDAQLERMLRDVMICAKYGRKNFPSRVKEYLLYVQNKYTKQDVIRILEGRLLYEVHALNSSLETGQTPFLVMLSLYDGVLTIEEKTAKLKHWIERYGKEYNKSNRIPTTLVEGIKKYIRENFQDPTLSVKHIAEVFYISSAYLSRIFRKEEHMTCIEYITNMRIDYAKSLLSNTDMRIRNIAEKAGYSNLYYFSAQFKKTTGETPGYYRSCGGKT